MKRTSTFIGSGLFFIFFLAFITISLMNRFMNKETAEVVEELKAHIKNREVYSYSLYYTDEAVGINEQRTDYIVPLPYSNWILASVLPYGVLDETIVDMGESRTRAMYIALAVMLGGILAVFGLYSKAFV